MKNKAKVRESFLTKESTRKLIAILGFEKAASFLSQFGGQLLWIPKLDTLERTVQHYRIWKDFLEGKSWDMLMQEYNLSEVQVKAIVKAWYESDYQKEILSWPE